MSRLIACFLIVTTILQAQDTSSPVQQKITPEWILSRYMEASGGDKRRGIQTIEMSGSVTLGRSGAPASGDDVHFWRKFPDTDALEFDTRSHGIARICNKQGKLFVERGVTAIGAINFVSIHSMREALVAVTDYSWKERFTNLELLGVSPNGSRKSYVIGLTLKNGDRQVWYFDSEYFLLVRIDMAEKMKETLSGPVKAYKLEAHLSDYQNTGGLRFPHTIAFECSFCGIQLNILQVKINPPLDEKIFATNH
jgi:hypothetical protein